MKLLEKTIQAIPPIDPTWIDKAARRQLDLTKPPESLGCLEEIANRCVAIRETFAITAARPRIVLFAANHGVCEEGVSAYPQAVTAQMVATFHNGGAAINALARVGGIELKVIDVGVASGSNNFCKTSAMTPATMRHALETGITLANEAANDGCDLLGFGEMGIGNTTSASAIAAALTGQSVESVLGSGAGADDATMARKRSAIERGLALHASQLDQPLGILQSVGGLEIAAMCGFCLGASAHRLPVVTDGFIATSAAALAVRMSPDVAGYLFAGHKSTEPGHAPLLKLINQESLLDLRMRLGEGTGAALAMKIIQAAVAAFTEMATFASAGVSSK
jgi:nicotinate-nucleotide--dimethylbenzimidazole phosphoribosyltransferase